MSKASDYNYVPGRPFDVRVKEAYEAGKSEGRRLERRATKRFAVNFPITQPNEGDETFHKELLGWLAARSKRKGNGGRNVHSRD